MPNHACTQKREEWVENKYPRWPSLTLLTIHVFKQSPYAPATLLLGIDAECLTAYHRETGTPVCVLLFSAAKKLPSLDVLTKQMDIILL